MAEMPRPRWGKERRASKLSPDPATFLELTAKVLTALQTLSSGLFMEASLLWHDWLNCSPLAIDSTHSPIPLPGCGPGWVKGTESSNPLITGWFPILSCFPKVTSLTSSGVVQSSLLWIFTTFIILLILEIPRVLSSVPETRWGSDMYLLLYVMISYIFLFPRYFVAPSFCWNRSSSISLRNGLH